MLRGVTDIKFFLYRISNYLCLGIKKPQKYQVLLLSPQIYENYIKLTKEIEHYESSKLEKKQKGKDLSKLIKQYQKSSLKKQL